MPLVESPTPFTDWVRNGAKEHEWQRFLRDQEEKRRREASKDREELEKTVKFLNEAFRDVELRTITEEKE